MPSQRTADKIDSEPSDQSRIFEKPLNSDDDDDDDTDADVAVQKTTGTKSSIA